MLKFCSLYSGSSGNCLFVESASTKLLIDVGVSAKKIVNALNSINVNIEDIDAILITHEHTDHVLSLSTISKKYNIPVYANLNTWSKLESHKQKISDKNIKYFTVEKEFNIKDIKIFPFSIPHDAIDPCGFNLFNGNSKISIATDLGHINPYIFSQLENSSFVMLESNYEPDILKMCSYPYNLKNRISGPNGHLSNNTAGKLVCKLVDSGLKCVMLGHLSKESNFPELAYNSVLNELKENNFSCDVIDLNVASRFEPSKIIDVS